MNGNDNGALFPEELSRRGESVWDNRVDKSWVQVATSLSGYQLQVAHGCQLVGNEVPMLAAGPGIQGAL